MSKSDIVLLNSEITLMVYVRSMEVLNLIVFIATIRIIHTCSNRSLGAYKYCLYQIVIWPMFSNQCALMGPIFAMPIAGAYFYIDFTDNPAIMHGIVCYWILITAFDIMSIIDGFNFRLRVLLKTFYPKWAYKPYWISTTILPKILAVIMVIVLIVPIAQHLNRADMRAYLKEKYPNAVPKFDEYKTFIVYDLDIAGGFKELVYGLSSACVVGCIYATCVISTIFRVLHLNRGRMSFSTQRMHARLLAQLSLQAAVPFIILICPLAVMLALSISEFPFENNWPGYVLFSFLMIHGPLTSFMTIAMYDPYRKAVTAFFNKTFGRRAVSPVSANTFVSLSLSRF